MSVVESFRDGRFRVVALAAGRNVERLAAQVERHRPELVAVEKSARRNLRRNLRSAASVCRGSRWARRGWSRWRRTGRRGLW